MPDHSIIVLEITVAEANDNVIEDGCLNREHANTSSEKYSFDNMPVNLIQFGERIHW